MQRRKAMMTTEFTTLINTFVFLCALSGLTSFSGGDLPSYAALCRSRSMSRDGKIALLAETSSHHPLEGTS
jgi:hypothetical protein